MTNIEKARPGFDFQYNEKTYTLVFDGLSLCLIETEGKVNIADPRNLERPSFNVLTAALWGALKARHLPDLTLVQFRESVDFSILKQWGTFIEMVIRCLIPPEDEQKKSDESNLSK